MESSKTTTTNNNNNVVENENDIPVAEATMIRVAAPAGGGGAPPPAAAAAAAATTSRLTATSAPASGGNGGGLIYVDLPIGSPTGGITFTGRPVQIAKVDSTTTAALLDNNADKIQPGLFLHSIQISHDLAISHFHDATRVEQLLTANSKAELRRLGLSVQSPGLGIPDDGLYYAHTLPQHVPCTLEGLQITIQGFPPIIQTVASTSPLANKIHPNQVVVQLQIPGRPTLNTQSPGFTAYRIQQELESYYTQSLSGWGGSSTDNNIVLTVKEALVLRKLEKGTNVACDDCIIL